MKKFFKTLALVLTLALVVGVIPAAPATVNAATVLKSKYLYVGGAKGESTEGKKSVLKERVAIYKLAGYTSEEAEDHTFKAEKVTESDAIKITSKYVYAKGIGDVDVKIYVDDVEAGVTTIKSRVNATEDTVVIKGLEDEFIVGAKYTFKLPRADKDSWQRRLFINDKEVAETADHARVYEYTFSEDEIGEATIKYEAFQSKKFNKGFFTKTVTVKVTPGTMSVLQSAYNAFKMTFSAEGVAAIAAKATTDSLTEGTAYVTENKNVIKIFELGANDEAVATFISDVSMNKEVIELTTFADLKEKTKYRVEYLNFEPVTFTACEWTPDHLTNSYAYTPNTDEKGGTAKLYTRVMAVGEKGQDVDITGKVINNGYVEYADAAAVNDYTKYTVAGDLVDFYENNATAPVKSTFTYYKGSNTIIKDNTFNVLAKDTRKYAVIGYKLINVNTGVAVKYTTTKIPNICVDDGYKDLDICIGVDVDGDGKYQDDFNGDGIVDNNDFIFIKAGVNAGNVKLVTSNTDKLAVDNLTGLTYSPKESEGKIGVYVYYKDIIVDGDPTTDKMDPIYVNVYAKRVLDHITVTAGNTKYSYSEDDALVNTNLHAGKTYAVESNAAKFTITAYDQWGDKYPLSNITVEKSTSVLDGAVYSGAADVEGLAPNYALFGGSGSKTDKEVHPLTSQFVVYLKGTTDTTGIKTVSFKVTAEDTIGKKVDTKTFAFTVKNCNKSTITSTVVEQVADGVNYTYRVVGKDSAGYTAIGYYLADVDDLSALSATALATKLAADKAAAVPEIYVGIYKNSTGKLVDYDVNPGLKTFTLDRFENAKYGGLTRQNITAVDVAESNGSTTGAAITVAANDLKAILGGGNWDKYIEQTSYSARAYKANNTSKSIVVANSKSFQFAAPNTYRIDWKWNKAYSEFDDLDAIEEAIDFTLYAWDAANSKWDAVNDEPLPFSELAGVTGRPFWLSYSNTQKENQKSILYIYTINGEGVYLETPILRTLYTNYDLGE